jgi:microcystin-dependent protein
LQGDIIAMNPFLGSISLFAFNFAPVGWHACDGTLLSISQNTALFSLIGTKFGGDGITTFALPKLPTVGSPGIQRYIALNGIYPSRN